MGVEPEVNQVLTHLSRHLVPPDEVLKRREQTVRQVFELLKDKSRFGLDRLVFMCSSSGSGGKIGIVNSVLDCVVFVNLVGVSGISSALENFDQIISSAKIPTLQIIKRTQIALRVQFKGYDFDLIPAVNFVPRPRQQQLSGRTFDLESEQTFYTLEMISRDLEKAEMYSSSLTETHIRFMKQQSNFIHDLVRICKFWTKCQFQFQCQQQESQMTNSTSMTNLMLMPMSLSLPIWTLIELIAVYAGQLEETKSKSKVMKKPSVLNAFITFLRLVEDFTSLKIGFLDFDPLKPARSIVNFPQLSGGQNSSLRKSRYVIEPANPFNNIAKTISKQQAEQLQKAAGDAVCRLVALGEGPVFKRTGFLSIFGPVSFFPEKFLA